jgi:hypothetical protein
MNQIIIMTNQINQQNYIKKMEDLIKTITETKTDIQIINMFEIESLIQHLNCLIKKKPPVISMYTNTLVQLSNQTKEKCAKCERIALYQRMENEKLCWIHSQELNFNE